jgi:GT2 family glycosyltransferase
VIVVDNGSAPSDRDLLTRSLKGRVRLVFNESNLGFGGGMNVGIRAALQAGADYVLLLNNDTIVHDDLLKEMVAVAHSDPKVGICGPKILYLSEPQRIHSAGGFLITLLGQPFAFGYREADTGHHDDVRIVDYVSGACMLISRHTLVTVGLLPEHYFLQWEDVHYCFAVRKAGLKVVCVGRAKVWHAVSRTFRRRGLMDEWTERGMRNRVWFMKSFYSWPLLFLSLASILLFLFPALFMYFTVRRLNPDMFALSMRGFISGISSTPRGER